MRSSKFHWLLCAVLARWRNTTEKRDWRTMQVGIRCVSTSVHYVISLACYYVIIFHGAAGESANRVNLIMRLNEMYRDLADVAEEKQKGAKWTSRVFSTILIARGCISIGNAHHQQYTLLYKHDVWRMTFWENISKLLDFCVMSRLAGIVVQKL